MTKKAPARVDELTPAQLARQPEWRDRWIANGLSTKPMDDADKKIAGESITALYQVIGLPAPRLIYVSSLHAGVMAVKYIVLLMKILEKTPAPQGAEKIPAQVRAQVWAQVGDQVRDQVGDQVRAQVWAQVGAQVWAQVWDQVRAQVEKIDFGNLFFGGNLWSSDASWISFFREVAPVGFDFSRWMHFENLVTHSGPCFFLRSYAIVMDRPKAIHVDARGRSHNDDGPFLEYRDGTGLYAIHGMTVPAWLIEQPELITIEKISEEPNAEIRRIMIEKFGPTNYMMKAGMKLIDEDCLKLRGSAPRALFEDKFKNKWLYGSDGSTGRVYSMAVPRTARSCREAHEAISGFDENACIGES